MTPEQRNNLIKTLVVVMSGVLSLLAAFGPLAQYREWILLAVGVVAVIASALGISLQSPVAQVQSIKSARKGQG